VAGHDLNYIGDTGLLALSMGSPEQPVLPPALIADLAGGTYPAVVNVLLGLMRRRQTGEGCYLDVAMTDNMFMLAYWAMAQGLVTGRWPQNGAGLVTGGSPRYQLYPARDRRIVAVASIEQKFWDRLCELINLPAELRDDSKDRLATIAGVRDIIATEDGDHWRKLFYGEDCCCSVVQSLEEALSDEHFRARGLFDHVLANEEGAVLPATPVSVAPQFRRPAHEPQAAPALGAHNDEILKSS